MSEEQPEPSGKRRRNPSSRLADESNDGEFVLKTHRTARARAIEDEHTRRAPLGGPTSPADPSRAFNPVPDITSTSEVLVTPALSRPSSIANINQSRTSSTADINQSRTSSRADLNQPRTSSRADINQSDASGSGFNNATPEGSRGTLSLPLSPVP